MRLTVAVSSRPSVCLYPLVEKSVDLFVGLAGIAGVFVGLAALVSCNQVDDVEEHVRRPAAAFFLAHFWNYRFTSSSSWR